MPIQELDLLVKAYLDGDKSAFEQIYQLTYLNVFCSVYCIVKNKNSVDDFIQETYIKALEKLHTYKLGTNFKAWIGKIAHNLTINGLKSKKELTLDPSQSPHILLKEAPVKDTRIEKALSLLEGDELLVFKYTIVDGLSVKETAKEMNVNINRVYYLISLMKKSLMFIMDNY